MKIQQRRSLQKAMLNLRQSNRTALLDPSCKSEETLTPPNSLHCSLPLSHLRTSLLANNGTPANSTVYKLDRVRFMMISLLNNIFLQVLFLYFFVVCFHNLHVLTLLRLNCVFLSLETFFLLICSLDRN